jgi:hypothetical protein
MFCYNQSLRNGSYEQFVLGGFLRRFWLSIHRVTSVHPNDLRFSRAVLTDQFSHPTPLTMMAM